MLDLNLESHIRFQIKGILKDRSSYLAKARVDDDDGFSIPTVELIYNKNLLDMKKTLFVEDAPTNQRKKKTKTSWQTILAFRDAYLTYLEKKYDQAEKMKWNP